MFIRKYIFKGSIFQPAMLDYHSVTKIRGKSAKAASTTKVVEVQGPPTCSKEHEVTLKGSGCFPRILLAIPKKCENPKNVLQKTCGKNLRVLTFPYPSFGGHNSTGIFFVKTLHKSWHHKLPKYQLLLHQTSDLWPIVAPSKIEGFFCWRWEVYSKSAHVSEITPATSRFDGTSVSSHS